MLCLCGVVAFVSGYRIGEAMRPGPGKATQTFDDPDAAPELPDYDDDPWPPLLASPGDAWGVVQEQRAHGHWFDDATV